MTRRIFKIILILAILGGFFILPNFILGQTADHLVISEIQIAGVTADDEFIEIYNPTSSAINLEALPLKLHIRNSSGTDQNRALTFINTTIPAHGYFLVGPASGYSGSMQLDATYSTSGNKLVANGGVYISRSITAETDIIDKVGWGDQPAPGYEGSAISVELSANQSIERRPGGEQGNGEDTNNNSADFFLQISPNPQNSQSPPQPPIEEPPPTEPMCGNGICETGEDEGICPIDCSLPPPPSSFSPSDVVINEFMPNPAEGQEWIEVYLNAAGEINLTGWKIADGTGSNILSLSGVLNQTARFAAFDLSSARLNNPGDIIILKAPDSAIIDQSTYGNWDDGNQADNAPAPSKAGQAVARKSNGLDTNNDSADFLLTDEPTKGSSNVILQTEIIGGGTQTEQGYDVPDAVIYINEFVSDPEDGEQEWVELYNAGQVSVDLEGWYLEEGSKAKTSFSGTLIPGQFLLISPVKGYLNNSGDIIYLKDNRGNIFDRVAYGLWDDGDVSDNAPTASDPYSIARVCDGCDSQNPSRDFIVAMPTKGKSNWSEGQTAAAVNEAKIIINELLPDPKGDDAEGEFIELKNLENQAVNLQNWYLKDESGKKYLLKANIEGKGLLLIKRTESRIALNNSADTLYLFSPDDSLKDKVIYSKAKEGLSFARFEDSSDGNNISNGVSWRWTSEPTPGKENIFAGENRKPQIVLSAPEQAEAGEAVEFEAGDSYDEDEDRLEFHWLIDGKELEGAAVNYIFSKAGIYQVVLTASDGKEEVVKKIKITILESLYGNEFSQADIRKLFISEVLPNPKGSDNAEWIELYYGGEKEFDLSGFKLDDGEGGSRPYAIKDLKALPGAFLIFPREETKIAFNNSGDKVRFFDRAGNLIDETEYGKAPEGLSWSRQGDGGFIWTKSSQGEPNNSDNLFVQTVSSGKSDKKTKAVLEIDLKGVRDEDLGELVKTRGIVSVPPGILGSQIFYISGSGMQIYMYKKDFPDLRIGDLIEIVGEISEARGEKRIKIAAKEDIKIISGNDPVASKEVTASEIGEDLEGSLITAEGIIIEIKGNRLILDDGGDEFAAYLKSTAGLSAKNFKEGTRMKITGILSQNNNNYEILPRFPEDMEILEENVILDFQLQNERDADAKGNAKKYLSFTAGGLASALAALALRGRLLRLIPFGMLMGIVKWRRRK